VKKFLGDWNVIELWARSEALEWKIGVAREVEQPGSLAWERDCVVMSIFANSITLYKLAVAFNVGVDKEVFGYNVVEVCGSHLMSRQGCG